jgi:hypothetical protein
MTPRIPRRVPSTLRDGELKLERLCAAIFLALRTADGPILTSRYARMVYVGAVGFVALVVTVLLNPAAPDIVYKAF